MGVAFTDERGAGFIYPHNQALGVSFQTTLASQEPSKEVTGGKISDYFQQKRSRLVSDVLLYILEERFSAGISTSA